MAKLTRKQHDQLSQVVSQLAWAQDYLMSDNVVVAIVGRPDDVAAYVPNGASAPSCYPHPALRPITKDVGSPLCSYATAIKSLSHFLLDNG